MKQSKSPVQKLYFNERQTSIHKPGVQRSKLDTMFEQLKNDMTLPVFEPPGHGVDIEAEAEVTQSSNKTRRN